MKNENGALSARILGAFLAAFFLLHPSPAISDTPEDHAASAEGVAGIAATPGSPDASSLAALPHSEAKFVADGLYMDGIWVATYGAGYSTITLTLPYIYNNRPYTTGTLRLSYWASTSYVTRGNNIYGYRLANFTTFAPLGPSYYYYNIVRSSSMSVPPNGTYWLILALEEYDPYSCPATGYCLVDSLISSAQRTFGPVTADVSMSQTPAPNPAGVGKDLVFNLSVYNGGPSAASNVVVSDNPPAASTYVWASPGCTGTTTITCSVGSLAAGATANLKVVVRPTGVGVVTNTASVSASEFDSSTSNNSTSSSVTVNTVPAGVPVYRYRLYSPVSLEHHFTTDPNEYFVLGNSGAWVPEGTVGKVFNNPAMFNGLVATPYYRLYNTTTRWHHWTTDPNEYYTLITYPGWNGEGVDGYILPNLTAGAMQLFRLVYPNGTGLHHWTVDTNEYTTLIAVYGWVGEGGAGFVLQ